MPVSLARLQASRAERQSKWKPTLHWSAAAAASCGRPRGLHRQMNRHTYHRTKSVRIETTTSGERRRPPTPRRARRARTRTGRGSRRTHRETMPVTPSTSEASCSQPTQPAPPPLQRLTGASPSPRTPDRCPLHTSTLSKSCSLQAPSPPQDTPCTPSWRQRAQPMSKYLPGTRSSEITLSCSRTCQRHTVRMLSSKLASGIRDHTPPPSLLSSPPPPLMSSAPPPLLSSPPTPLLSSALRREASWL
mmetsp:Transcript_60482/g.124457  ORF Transcript_60482/g.124457 Transcript_60482/m.124457 type:complete len:247 (+) Transcript_60482:3266-4006(+)